MSSRVATNMAHRAERPAVAVSLLVCAGVLWSVAAAQSRAPTDAQGAAGGDRPSFVLRARAVYPVTAEQPGPLTPGVVVVRDGRIVAVGSDLPTPEDLPLIDLPDEVVCPGFVDAANSLVGAHTGRESVSAAFRADDAFDAFDEYVLPLSRGITTAHISPGGHRLVSGLGAVVKLGGPPADRVIEPAADLTINLGVFGPPPLIERPFYASSDVPIEPATVQRPHSRLGQIIELQQRIAEASRPADPEAKFDLHRLVFAQAWAAGTPLRVAARRAEDIESAVGFIKGCAGGGSPRPAYLVGLTEADRLASELADEGFPLVFCVDLDYRHAGANLGGDPGAMRPSAAVPAKLAAARGSRPQRLALAGAEGDGEADVRLAAILAVRGGLAEDQALAAVTRVPAEILGVADRVGSLAPGRDADLLVLTGRPLDLNSFVRRAYVGGRVAFDADTMPRGESPPRRAQAPAEPPRPVVVRAGTIWVNDALTLRARSGDRVELLMEDGRVAAVGARVPHPPRAQIVDAGDDGFVTPGFIDAHGHLGLQGDTGALPPDLRPHWMIGVADREFRRVARAGVTTVLLSPYRAAPNGARLAAIKTAGAGREELVGRELAAVQFPLRGQDPVAGVEQIRKVLQVGKQYDDTWKKYDEELAKWKAGGSKPAEKKPEQAEKVVEKGQADPITGRWQFTVRGDPLPGPVSGTMVMRLIGTQVEGRMTDPSSGEEVRLSGTWLAGTLTLDVEIDTPLGRPRIVGTLEREDHLVGTATLGQFTLDVEATRTDKSAVEFTVQRSSRRSKDGRPAPPKIDENLEPLRPLLAGKIPAVVEVGTAAEVVGAMKLLVEEFKLPLVLLGADEAVDVAGQLLAHREQVGVIVPREIEQTRRRAPYYPAADLSRLGLRVALQSDAEDGAASLPEMALFAVGQGMGADAALRAMTIDAARMFKLDDRVGSLEAGKDADVLIFSGHPFDADGRLERVFVGGCEVRDE